MDSTGQTRGGVCAVVVTFRPDPALLDEVLRAAATQVDHLVVIDNGSDADSVAALRSALDRLEGAGLGARVSLRLSDSNEGLPKPFNTAIGLARESGDRFVLFLDHDSILMEGAVQRLVQEYGRLPKELGVGALEAFNEEPFTLVTDDFLSEHFRRRGPSTPDGTVENFLATNSGLFVPLEVLARTGGFDETYFLDAVDFEFGLRLRANGFRLLRVPSARIRHWRGETGRGADAWRIRRVRPFRHYYVARDTLRTLFRYGRRFPLIGLMLLSMPIREGFLVLFFYSDRRTHLHYLGLGTLHGLLGIGGPMPPARSNARP